MAASNYENLSPAAVEKERIRKKKYKKDHPEIVSAINKRTYAKRKLVSIECTTAEVKQFMAENTYCVQCFAEDELTLDHIIPISWGFLSYHGLGNFQVLCNTCNGRKKNYFSIDFRI